MTELHDAADSEADTYGLIARRVDVADVIAAVNFGRAQGMLLAIRGGGHNGPGLGSCDDGLVIDLSVMKSVRAHRQRDLDGDRRTGQLLFDDLRQVADNEAPRRRDTL